MSLKVRKTIFRALVAVQDKGVSVPESKRIVMVSFKISKAQLKSIEDQGVEEDWPPLVK